MKFIEDKGYIIEPESNEQVSIYCDINKIAPPIPTDEDTISSKNLKY